MTRSLDHVSNGGRWVSLLSPAIVLEQVGALIVLGVGLFVGQWAVNGSFSILIALIWGAITATVWYGIVVMEARLEKGIVTLSTAARRFSLDLAQVSRVVVRSSRDGVLQRIVLYGNTEKLTLDGFQDMQGLLAEITRLLSPHAAIVSRPCLTRRMHCLVVLLVCTAYVSYVSVMAQLPWMIGAFAVFSVLAAGQAARKFCDSDKYRRQGKIGVWFVLAMLAVIALGLFVSLLAL